MNHELSDDNSIEQEFKETNPKEKLSKRLQKTITEYEDLLNRDLFKDENEKQSAQKLLKTLKSQLDSHTTPKPLSKVPEESIEEKREKSLQELFSFYAKQHIPPGLPFEKLEETLQTINVGELVIFCKDFGIDLSRNELMLIYKKEAENNNPHKFKQFMHSLKKICELRHGKQIQKLKNRIKELNGLLGIKSYKNHQSEDYFLCEYSNKAKDLESGQDSDTKYKIEEKPSNYPFIKKISKVSEPRVKRDTQQIYISQLNANRQNKSAIKLSKTKAGQINGAYDYAKETIGGSVSKRDIIARRDERSVPKVSQSFQTDYLNTNISSVNNPKSKQAIIKDGLKLVGSQQDLKKNQSMHYRRSTQSGVDSMNIYDSYTVSLVSNKILRIK